MVVARLVSATVLVHGLRRGFDWHRCRLRFASSDRARLGNTFPSQSCIGPCLRVVTSNQPRSSLEIDSVRTLFRGHDRRLASSAATEIFYP
jgi:hypothetical protein